jgi:hypothetical protein
MWERRQGQERIALFSFFWFLQLVKFKAKKDVSVLYIELFINTVFVSELLPMLQFP